jgi:2',3'-cyclic-nucleotide 2'-phosphodiesterase (5'-nucleotidase family)
MTTKIIFFSLLLFTACSRTVNHTLVDTKVYKLNIEEFSSEDSLINVIIQPYKTSLETEMGKILAVSAQPMDKGQPEGVLGNFVADLSMDIAKMHYQSEVDDSPDFCFMNNGGLRSTLQKGNISVRDVYRLMPFENELVVLTLNGRLTFKLLEFIAAKGGMPVSGLKMGISNNQPVAIFIQGAPFNADKTYRILTSDYLANGGDNLEFLADAQKRDDLRVKVRDAIIEYLTILGKAEKQAVATLDKRLYYEK